MKIFACLLLIAANFLPSVEAKTVKLLTIGNSFANNATEYLPALVQAGGDELLIFRANPGGCTFERHAGAMHAFELNPADPKGQLYGPGFFPPRPNGRKTYSLQQALDAEKWDFVTIQQYSNDSYKYETFEPFAKDLIECIHKHAPQAEILIFQTWAYRQDYPGFADGKFNQQMMFDQVVASYAKLGAQYHLRIIPIGTAIQQARALPRWTFKFPDPNFNYVDPQPGTKPDQSGSLNVGWTIAKKSVKKAPMLNDEQAVPGTTPGTPPPVVEEGTAPVSSGTGAKAAPGTIPNPAADKLVATLDFKHCNAEGKYLGASVLYGFLYQKKTAPLSYVATGVTPEDGATLRGIADQVLATATPAAH